jgi:hypothetical protein
MTVGLGKSGETARKFEPRVGLHRLLRASADWRRAQPFILTRRLTLPGSGSMFSMGKAEEFRLQHLNVAVTARASASVTVSDLPMKRLFARSVSGGAHPSL